MLSNEASLSQLFFHYSSSFIVYVLVYHIVLAAWFRIKTGAWQAFHSPYLKISELLDVNKKLLAQMEEINKEKYELLMELRESREELYSEMTASRALCKDLLAVAIQEKKDLLESITA